MPHVSEPETGLTSDPTSGADISIPVPIQEHIYLDESANSEQEFTDALEALDDANTSREADPVSSNAANPSMNFPSLDTDITLTDIERHDQSRGTSHFGSTARPTPRYNLRSRIKPPERYGEATSSNSSQKPKSKKYSVKLKSPLKKNKK